MVKDYVSRPKLFWSTVQLQFVFMDNMFCFYLSVCLVFINLKLSKDF